MRILKRLKKAGNGERGNALLYVFIAIAVLAGLTFALSSSNDDSENISEYAVADEQITRLLSYSATLAASLNQMVLAGANAPTLYTDLSTLNPSEAGYNTAPHKLKIFHPMGGGMNYINSTGPVGSSDTVATDMKINKGSIIEGVGPTNITVGDIVFVATVHSAKACERINFILTGSATMPIMKSAIFTDLFVSNITTDVASGLCTDCVNRPQICVTNIAGTQWGFYSVLYPG